MRRSSRLDHDIDPFEKVSSDPQHGPHTRSKRLETEGPERFGINATLIYHPFTTSMCYNEVIFSPSILLLRQQDYYNSSKGLVSFNVMMRDDRSSNHQRLTCPAHSILLFAFFLTFLTTVAAEDDNPKSRFIFPDRGFLPIHLHDTLLVSYISSFPTPGLYLWCDGDDGPKNSTLNSYFTLLSAAEH